MEYISSKNNFEGRVAGWGQSMPTICTFKDVSKIIIYQNITNDVRCVF